MFIERDGIFNEVSIGKEHWISPLTLEEFKPKFECAPGVAKLKDAGLLIIVTTHQPGLSGGHQSRRELDRMHDILSRTFLLSDIMLCPHDESDQCPCCRPKPGLFIEAAFKHHLDLDHSFVISDKWQDAEAARTAGVTSILIKSPWSGVGRYDFLVTDFTKAVEKILGLVKEKK